MSGFLLFRRIVFPIAVRQALPAYGNEIILMVKATSLASIVTMMEVTGIAHKLISQTFRAVEIFIVAGAIYLDPELPRDAGHRGARILALAASAPGAPHPIPARRGGARVVESFVSSAASTETPAVSVQNLRKSFGSLEVLKGVSLSARTGDVISILGASGSGKSTMLRCINMLEVPDSGEIRIGGEAIGLRQRRGRMEPADRAQVDRIRSRVAMVFQSFNLWSHMTVLENVIEAPLHVQRRPKAECVAEARRSSPRWASRTSATTIPPTSPAASSSGRRSPGRSPCGPT
jgi:ABC-type glutathione transport system ATPase component